MEGTGRVHAATAATRRRAHPPRLTSLAPEELSRRDGIGVSRADLGTRHLAA